MTEKNFAELARSRYSCRKYDSRPVEPEKLDMVLEAGRIAPSAVNRQPWHFYAITEAAELNRVYELYHREWFRTAPCVLVLCADHEQSWKRKADGKDHADVDLSIAADHMTLQATDLGLATCWICNFDTDKTRTLFRLPDHLEAVALLALGYPLDEGDPARHADKRKALEEIVTRGIPA